jgi:hypothetical protein
MKTHSCLFFFLIILSLSSCSMRKSVRHLPDILNFDTIQPEIKRHHAGLFSSKENYLVKNEHSQWEIYISGDPLQRGLLYGGLLDSLLLKQEQIFFDKIKEFVPSERKQKRLRRFLQWYNRKLYLHVPNELQVEIFGLSQFSTSDYHHIAPPFIRGLYLHAAHDIGHALSDWAMVGCTSVALWGSGTEDGELLIGRNFDFYAGDEFAKEKVISFIRPHKGIPFASISWPGMLGVVSGMNLEGLTVTMNAGKSSIPLKAKKPISILAREILQYCSTIEEAIDMANNSEVFVSESLMIGSAKDKKSVLIEIAPKNIGVYEVDNNQLVCSNHFQSEAFSRDKRNNNHIKESHSQYRFERLTELLDESAKMNPILLSEILRNRKGLENAAIGFGNEKALNQLLAHHSVIFKPESGLMWVSSNPYQLGAFTVYNLNEIFGADRKTLVSNMLDSLEIPVDEFLESEDYKKYEKFRIMDREIDKLLNGVGIPFNREKIEYYKGLNPNFWLVHYKVGLLYQQLNDYQNAKLSFETALEKEITTTPDREKVEIALKKNNKRIK